MLPACFSRHAATAHTPQVRWATHRGIMYLFHRGTGAVVTAAPPVRSRLHQSTSPCCASQPALAAPVNQPSLHQSTSPCATSQQACKEPAAGRSQGPAPASCPSQHWRCKGNGAGPDPGCLGDALDTLDAEQDPGCRRQPAMPDLAHHAPTTPTDFLCGNKQHIPCC